VKLLLDLLEGLYDKIMENSTLMNSLVNFLEPYFQSDQSAKDFIDECYQIPTHETKRALHQLYRFMSLSNEFETLETGSVMDGFHIFFWIVAIEAMNKATTPLLKKQKIQIVRDFFKENINGSDQEILIKNVMKDTTPHEATTIEIVADMFNTVRNMVAHEGIYWMFTFPTNSGDSNLFVIPKEKTSQLSTYTMGEENFETFNISLTKVEVRDIIIRGALNYLKKWIDDRKRLLNK
jgi:hypothetical protein